VTEIDSPKAVHYVTQSAKLPAIDDFGFATLDTVIIKIAKLRPECAWRPPRKVAQVQHRRIFCRD
jgi:hypothetical protein